MSNVPSYQIPIYKFADHRIKFQVEGYNLTSNTAKLQFVDANSGAVQLELSTANGKIIIEVTDTNSGFITLIISSADGQLLTVASQWDLFVIDGTGKRKPLVKGDVCYTNSKTSF